MEPFAVRTPPPARLLLFARLPEAGRVKTRLARDIGDERALALHEAMLGDVLETIGDPGEEFELEVLWTGSAETGGDTLRAHFGDRAVAQQTGATLGDRMAMAMSERFFFHATQKIAVIGTDDPLLPRELLSTTFHLLDCCEWVVGPANDGGYYLLGCRAASYHSSVFEGIEWGGPAVFETTMARIRALGASVAVLPRHVDVDVAEDLRALAPRLMNERRRVGQLLQTWGWKWE